MARGTETQAENYPTQAIRRHSGIIFNRDTLGLSKEMLTSNLRK